MDLGLFQIRPISARYRDHRVVDGQGSVTCLVHVKDAIEDPQRLLLDV